MSDRFGDIADALREAERAMRRAVSIAGQYRGPVIKDLAARDVVRRGVKAMIRIGHIADKVESRIRRKP